MTSLRSETLRNRSGPGVLRALFLLLSCGLLQPPTGATEPPPADAEFFEKNVRPLLVEKCWPCHGDANGPRGACV